MYQKGCYLWHYVLQSSSFDARPLVYMTHIDKLIPISSRVEQRATQCFNLTWWNHCDHVCITCCLFFAKCLLFYNLFDDYAIYPTHCPLFCKLPVWQIHLLFKFRNTRDGTIFLSQSFLHKRNQFQQVYMKVVRRWYIVQYRFLWFTLL